MYILYVLQVITLPFNELCSCGRCAVVTGANKWIVLEIVRQLASARNKVVLTARNEKRGLEALETLKASSISHLVEFH